MKNILYIWFSHFTLLTEIHWCQNYSLSLYFNKKRLSVLTHLPGNRNHLKNCWIALKRYILLQTRTPIMTISQYNSVLHAFSIPDYSEMCGVVDSICSRRDCWNVISRTRHIYKDITLLIIDNDFLHQFNVRLHHLWGVFLCFFQCQKKNNVFQKFAGMWLVGEVVNHVGLYESMVAEGCLAFQRQSSFSYNEMKTLGVFYWWKLWWSDQHQI